MPAPSLERLLVVRFGRIGDLLVLTPAIRALRGALPNATIELLTTSLGAATLSTNPHLDAIHVLRWRRLTLPLNPEKSRLTRQLRRRGFQAVLLFESAPRYERLIQRIGVPSVYGFAPPGEPESDSRVRPDPRLHAVQNNERVLSRFGVGEAGQHFDYPLDDEADPRAETLLAKHGIEKMNSLVGVHAGQFRRSRRWRRTPHPKAWPPERFAKVISELAERGARHFVLTGGADERQLADSIARRLPAGLATNFAGATDLQTLGAVIARCSLFISLDSGPAHIAAALGTPLVGLFGPTSPDLMGPLGDDDRIERIYLEPSSLGRRARQRYHARMWAIQVEHVIEAAAALKVEFT